MCNLKKHVRWKVKVEKKTQSATTNQCPCCPLLKIQKTGMALPPPVSLLLPFLNHLVLRPQVVQSKAAPTLGVGRLGERRPKQVLEPAQGAELSMGEGTTGLISRASDMIQL